MHRSNHRARLGLEPLEPRCLLAGNVAVAVINGNLILNGDAAANDVEVTHVDVDTFRVTGNSTTINGVAGPVDFDHVFQDIRFTGRRGSDKLKFHSASARRDLVFAGGPGDNELFVGNARVARHVLVTNGPGALTVELLLAEVGGDVRVQNGDGGMTLTADTVDILGRLQATSGAAGDLCQLTQSSVGDDAILRLGTGTQDQVACSVTDIDGDLRVRTGGGVDSLYAGHCTIGGSLVAALGGNNDLLDLESLLVFRDLTLVTGTGNDMLDLDLAFVSGRTTIDTGTGGDVMWIDDCHFIGFWTALTRGGNDTVEIERNGGQAEGTNFVAGVNLQLGGGNDALRMIQLFDPDTSVQCLGPARLNGGAGTDSRTDLGAFFEQPANIQGFEI